MTESVAALSNLALVTIIAPAFLGYSVLSYAAPEPQHIPAKLNEVTVFLRGAELFNSAKINLPAGESEVVFSNIATDINPSTLIIGTDNNVLIKSSQVRKNYLAQSQNDPIFEQYQRQFDELQAQREQLQINLNVVETQLSFIQSNLRLNSENGKSANINDIQGMWDFIDNKMKGVLNTEGQLKKQLADIVKKQEALTKQMKEIQANRAGSAGNQLVVTFYSEKPVATDVQLSYTIRNASWTPTYDVFVEQINQPVQLVYKASVAQASGINWDNVRLKLSTGNVNESTQAPSLTPNYLAEYLPEYFASTHFDVRGYGLATEDIAVPQPAPRADKKERQMTSLDSYVVTNVGGVNTSFDIAMSYSVASNGKQSLVAIKQQQVQGEYRYVAVPKLSSSAYLQVQLQDWENLNLLPGKSNIFFEGSFVGEGVINVNDIKDDTLNLSLGRDNNIIVNRESVAQLTKTPVSKNSTVVKNYRFQTDIKNTRSTPVKLVVLDQIPVSQDKNITISDVKYDNAGQLDKNSGELSWEFTILPGESKTLPLSYTVKYPKRMKVTGL